MTALYVLIPVSLLLASGALLAFLWASRKGQFNDLSSPAERLVLEDFLEENNVYADVTNGRKDGATNKR